MTRECLSVLLLGLLAGCEKETIVPEKPVEGSAKTDAMTAAAGPSAASSVGASEVMPAGSAKPKSGEKKCAPGGCAPGKCG